MGGMQKNHTTRVKGPLGLWSRPQPGQGGGGKGAEGQMLPGLTGLSGEKPPHTCLIACIRVWC